MGMIRKRPGLRGDAYEVRWRGLKGDQRATLTKTFKSERAAIGYLQLVERSATPPAPLCKGDGVLEFLAPMPRNGHRKISRSLVIDAFRAAYPTVAPTTADVIVHVIADVPPAAAVADVDNILKPILDALAGVAYVNDTQVVECMVRKVPSTQRRLRIQISLACGSTLRSNSHG